MIVTKVEHRSNELELMCGMILRKNKANAPIMTIARVNHNATHSHEYESSTNLGFSHFITTDLKTALRKISTINKENKEIIEGMPIDTKKQWYKTGIIKSYKMSMESLHFPLKEKHKIITYFLDKKDEKV